MFCWERGLAAVLLGEGVSSCFVGRGGYQLFCWERGLPAVLLGEGVSSCFVGRGD